MEFTKKQMRSLIKHKPKKGVLKKAKPFRVWFGIGHQVCGWRIVWAFTGSKWATYKVKGTDIRKRMKVSDWNLLKAEAIV